MLGELIAAIVIGFVAGFIGRALLPGDDSMGIIPTIIVGIIGSLVGFFLFTTVLGIGDDDKFDFGGIIGAIVGTMIVLALLRMFRGRGRVDPARGDDREHDVGGHERMEHDTAGRGTASAAAILHDLSGRPGRALRCG